MKVGDLVRWTVSSVHDDLGIITKRTSDAEGEHIFIHWLAEPEASAYYPTDHRYLELVNER